MKAKIILINWLLSWVALSVDTDATPFWACMACLIWFLVSTIMFNRAARRGDYKKLEKQLKIDDL